MSVKEPLWILEIEQPFCSLEYGVAPCEAVLGVTGEDRCFNTLFTCQDVDNYDPEDLVLRFGTDNARYDGKYIMPFIQQVSTSPAKINPAGSSDDVKPLGKRATVNIQMKDVPHNDFLVDKYERDYNPLERGTFWNKWVTRNPYYRYTVMRLKSGYVGDDYEDLEEKSYLLDKIDLQTLGSVTISGKDPLVLTAKRRATAPRATGGVLKEDISDSDTTIVVDGTFDGEYPAEGTLCIGSEVLTYTSGAFSDGEVTFTGIERGTDGTEADEHKEDERVQLCKRFINKRVDELLVELLIDYAGVNPDFIDTAEWEAEATLNLFEYIMSGLITEPEGVDDLIGEILESTMSYVYWHEKDNELKFRAYRPPLVSPPVVTEEKDILADSLSIRDNPEARISQVWVFWGQFDPTEDLQDENNFSRIRIRVIGDDRYADRNIRKIYSRWISNDEQAILLTQRMLARFEVPPKLISMSMLKNSLWLADYVAIETRRVVDQFGLPAKQACEVISAEETRDRINYGLQTYNWVAPPEIPIPDNMLILGTSALAGFDLCDGTNDTIDLIGKYLKAKLTQGGTGGSSEHEHTQTSPTTSQETEYRPRNRDQPIEVDMARPDHTHNIEHSHTGENVPESRTVVPYKGEGGITPAMLFFYDGEASPVGWESQEMYINKYIKCAEVGSLNEGDGFHRHNFTGETGVTTPLQIGGSPWTASRYGQFAHAHYMNHIHEMVYDLYRINLLPITVFDAEEIPDGVCAFFFGDTPPAGWSVFSEAEGRFVKGSFDPGTGGTLDHTHVSGDMLNQNTQTPNPQICTDIQGKVGDWGNTSTRCDHTHPMPHGHESQDWQPPFQELMFCRKGES